MKPLVTLLTPAYNAMPFLDSFLESVLAQTYPNIEFIVFNDGSKDNTAERLNEFAPLFAERGIVYQIISLDRNMGQAHAFNQMLPLASGDFLTWCDADDLLTPDSIEKKADYLTQHPSVGIVRSEVDIFNVTKQTKERTIKNPSKDGTCKDLFRSLFDETEHCLAGSYMLRTGILFDAYPMRRIPESKEGQNLQLLLPPASMSLCGFINEPLLVYRIHSDSHSHRKRSLNECFERNENFYSLRLQILEHCQCDREYFKKYACDIKEKCIRSILYSAGREARRKINETRNSKV